MNSDLKRHERELLNIVLNDNKKEYLMSVSTDGYAEIYDFDNNERKYTSFSQFTSKTVHSSLINFSYTIKYQDNYFSIIPFYGIVIIYY